MIKTINGYAGFGIPIIIFINYRVQLNCGIDYILVI